MQLLHPSENYWGKTTVIIKRRLRKFEKCITTIVCNNWPVCMYVNSSCCQLILKKISKNWNHQMSDFKAKMHQIRFPPGLRPRLRWGSLQRSPEPLAVFKKFMSKGREKRGGERENIQKTSLLTAIILRYL